MSKDRSSEEEVADLRARLVRVEKSLEGKRPRRWVCGSWPCCYHGRLYGAVFGCEGLR